MEEQNQKTSQGPALTIPMAIVIAGIIIAGAIFFTTSESRESAKKVAAPSENESAFQGEMRPVDETDHIRGNPNAQIVIVEYSDTECPFCKRFHTTMKQVMDEYGKDGKVAWVYRHFPLVQIHPEAPLQAQATECAAELGGNVKFWEYTDRIFEVTQGNNSLASSQLPVIAEHVGLNVTAFNECLSSNRYAEKVEAHYNDGIAAGARGTPYSIMIARNGQTQVINGAQPYSVVKQTIDAMLSQM